MEHNMMGGKQLMEDHILKAAADGRYSDEDLVSIFGPMLAQMEHHHALGQVLLTKGLDSFARNEHGRLRLSAAGAIETKTNFKALNGVLPRNEGSFDIVAEQRMTTDASGGSLKMDDEQAAKEDTIEKILAPMFVMGYRSYESVLDHHDPLTDIQTIGMYMASLAFGIDLRHKDGPTTLLQISRNPAYAGQHIHPNILRLILDMTELDRRKRIRDAYTASIRLENYQEYSAAGQESFDDVLARYEEKEGNRSHWILSKLRNRLFDLSKRNKLIYFKKSARSVNLTLSSVPYVMDYQNIRPDKLFIWNDEISEHFKSGKAIKLNRYLKMKENPQITTSLKKIYYEGNRDIAEFGFNQLKLAFCFLNWYNYKENGNEKIQSPLLLLPVGLKKKKGISDEFNLTISDTVVSVNPVLAYYLKELYDIRLPKTFDLATTSIDAIYNDIRKSIALKSNEVQLEMIKKPRLRLIHSLAKRSFEAFQKKILREASRSIWGSSGDYSYASNDFRPLGLKLYRDRVQAEASMLEFLIDEKVKLNQNAVDASVQREFFEIESDGSINPYKWEFDLCNFTLGNFNYQRMTLVNDYDSLLEEDANNKVFDSLFSMEPKLDFEDAKVGLALEDNYSVIPTDPTQLGAIEKAKAGRSYIIQGPPGTGKSQTIVNLLTNKVAEGKSILFISEKRAALDVVYARMSQSGLKDICTLIHDSQSDKKGFIFDLKDTYEKYSKDPNQYAKANADRNILIQELEELIASLSVFHNYQRSGSGSLNYRKVIDVLLSKGFNKNDLDPKYYDSAPLYDGFADQKLILDRLEAAIKSNTKYASMLDCPFVHMDRAVAQGDSASVIAGYCDTVENDLAYFDQLIKNSITDDVKTVSVLKSILSHVSTVAALHDDGKLALLDPHSDLSVTYDREQSDLKQMTDQLVRISDKNKYWKRKPSEDELRRLIKSYKEASSGFLNKLIGKKDQFKSSLAAYYDFDGQMIAPDLDEIFRDIQEELELSKSIQDKMNNNQVASGLKVADLSAARSAYDTLVESSGNADLYKDGSFVQLLDSRSEWSGRFDTFQKAVDTIAPRAREIDGLYDYVDELRISAPALFTIAPRLSEWFDLQEDLRSYILDNQLTIDQVEYASAYRYLLTGASENGANITGAEISRIVEAISDLYPRFLKNNSVYIQEKVKKNFQDVLDLSFIPAYDLTKEQKAKKDNYFTGRATLENEFSKKIRYKSIRELAEGDTGAVVKDLKPIWMMSPLSVSDALPLQNMFDIVVFDEASQITVEEGVPPLYRADQAIIVGDEMQMPPSDFFSTKVDETEDEAEFLSMDAESLLNQGARKLPQVTLGWHYRSKKEALINFSNFAFYQGGLMTIPDVNNPNIESKPIEVFECTDAVKNVDELLSRSISYHYLPNGVYVNRGNDSEAEYIAHLVRELLLGKTNKSVGIVAFSMQQQGNIEYALSRLADKDPKFAVALEESYASKDDEEFTGLFVRNLENVQGDERDIMILSICYGYNPKGKMLMNFGPINRRGGEKRLNVIFSRSKSHMAVVSSIKYADIKNEYNEGANYLRRYLQYAELISFGEQEAAQAILGSLSRKIGAADTVPTSAVLVGQIKGFLSKDYHVDTHLGQSQLKIHLGIKKKADQPNYDLGIVIDSESSYQSDEVINEYYKTQNILKAFGWNIYKVFANDWLKNRKVVEHALINAIENRGALPEELVAIPAEVETAPTSDRVKIELTHLAKGKFWNIEREGLRATITMGDVGSDGVVNVQHFESSDEVMAYFDNQVANRKARGFE